MSLLAVQSYVAGLLGGIQTAGTPPAESWVLPPPVVQAADQPEIYVWGGRLRDRRATIPRVTGQRRVEHTVSIWVQWVTDQDASTIPNFVVLLDAIRAALLAVQLPVALTDPVTGATSSLTDFGEEVTQDYPPPQAQAPQSTLLQHNAGIGVLVHEWYEG